MDLGKLVSNLSFVGRKVRLGDYSGFVSEYVPMQDSFRIAFQLGGPSHTVSPAVLATILEPLPSLTPSLEQLQYAWLLNSMGLQRQQQATTQQQHSQLQHFTLATSNNSDVGPDRWSKSSDVATQAAIAMANLFASSPSTVLPTANVSSDPLISPLQSLPPISKQHQYSTSQDHPSRASDQWKSLEAAVKVERKHSNPTQPSQTSPTGVKPTCIAPRAPLRGTVSKTKSRTDVTQATTKTGVFKIMHVCYRYISGTNGRQDAFYGANIVPEYGNIEKALQTDENINAARLSTLRSRFLMTKTLESVVDLLPCPAAKYVVNSITTACPLCGRAIALNKLASHENWCKHLECSHGALGGSIANRFRALDKNLATVPDLLREHAQASLWVDVEDRQDMSPLDGELNRPHLVPFSSKLHWHALIFHQLLKETALLRTSVMTQELVATGLLYYGIELDASSRFKALLNFQDSFRRASNEAFAVYSDNCHPCVLIPPKPETSSKEGAQRKDLKVWLDEMRRLYQEDENCTMTYEEIERELKKIGGTRAVNAIRVVTLRQRQLMQDVLKECFDLNDGGKFVINVLNTACPFCDKVVQRDHNSNGLHDDSWCKHLELDHGSSGKMVAQLYRSLESNSRDPVKDKEIDKKPMKPAFADNTELSISDFKVRCDMAPTCASDSDGKYVPMDGMIDWRALMFDQLLRHKRLLPSSVLTQEIIVIGLFYFGLVNQRSPQKFGQYPQLHTFQKALHEISSSAYDIYCGAGIKEGELGSSHTRGRPVAATKYVVRRYHHYGLSHKSLQRNDRRKSHDEGSSWSMEAAAVAGMKRKKAASDEEASVSSRRRRSRVEQPFTSAVSGLPCTHMPYQPVEMHP